MGTYQPHRERPRRKNSWTRPECFLLSLIMLCLMGIFVLLPIVIEQFLHGSTMPEPHPTPSTVVSASPTPAPSPIPSPTPSLPPPPPGVLAYPLYQGNPL